jgi:hypothetical protein
MTLNRWLELWDRLSSERTGGYLETNSSELEISRHIFQDVVDVG